MLDVRRLRVLREVAARGSFSAAAEALHFTQSAVSQQIAALEREAGMPLVDRSARGVRLTHGGEVLCGHADAILARLADAEAELEAIAGLRGGRIRIAAFPTAGATIAPVAIARFRERHPGVDIRLLPADPDDGIEKLRAGEVDIALLIDTPWACLGGEGMERTWLLDDPMYVCLPRSHPRASRARLRLEDLADDAWLLGTTGVCPDTAILLRACAAAGFEPRIAFNSDDYGAIQGFVAAGMGVSLIPDLALVSVRDDVIIREIAPRPAVRQIVAGTLSSGYRSPQTTAMLEILAEVGAEFQTGRRELALAV